MITEQLRIKEIIHNILPMEYPPTSEDSIAIIYNIEAWDSFEAFTDNVSRFFQIFITKYLFLIINSLIKNLDPNIKNKVHCEVDMDTDLIQSTNEFLDIQRTREAKTYM